SRSLQLQASDEVPPLELDRVSRALDRCVFDLAHVLSSVLIMIRSLYSCRFTAFTMFLSDDAFLNLVHSLMKLSASTVTEGELSGATKMLLDICVRNCQRLHLFVDSVCNHTSKLAVDNRAGVRLSAVS